MPIARARYQLNEEREETDRPNESCRVISFKNGIYELEMKIKKYFVWHPKHALTYIYYLSGTIACTRRSLTPRVEYQIARLFTFLFPPPFVEFNFALESNRSYFTTWCTCDGKIIDDDDEKLKMHEKNARVESARKPSCWKPLSCLRGMQSVSSAACKITMRIPKILIRALNDLQEFIP